MRQKAQERKYLACTTPPKLALSYQHCPMHCPTRRPARTCLAGTGLQRCASTLLPAPRAQGCRNAVRQATRIHLTMTTRNDSATAAQQVCCFNQTHKRTNKRCSRAFTAFRVCHAATSWLSVLLSSADSAAHGSRPTSHPARTAASCPPIISSSRACREMITNIKLETRQPFYDNVSKPPAEAAAGWPHPSGM